MFDLQLQIKKLLIKSPLLKPYIDWVKFIPTNIYRTGATDGKVVYYNPEGLSKRTELGQQFTIIHELLHIALNHMERCGNRHPEIYNDACDAVINQMIKKMGIPIPEEDIDYPDAAGLSVEEYYEILIKKPEYQAILNSSTPYPKRSDDIAPHTAWGKNKESLEGRPKEVPEDEKEFQKENDEVKEKLADDFFDKLKTNAEHKVENKKVGNVGTATTFVSWEDLLRYELTKNKTDYDFFNGEFDEEGIWYYPYQTQKEEESEVEILIDSSYSVDDDLVRAFLREIKSIAGSARIKIGCFNDAFDGFSEIKDETDIDNFTITSRGGTDFEVAVQSFQSPTSVKIVFTDGYAREPKSFCEAIWIVYSEAKIKPPGGFVYNVDPNKICQNNRTK